MLRDELSLLQVPYSAVGACLITLASFLMLIFFCNIQFLIKYHSNASTDLQNMMTDNQITIMARLPSQKQATDAEVVTQVRLDGVVVAQITVAYYARWAVLPIPVRLPVHPRGAIEVKLAVIDKDYCVLSSGMNTKKMFAEPHKSIDVEVRPLTTIYCLHHEPSQP